MKHSLHQTFLYKFNNWWRWQSPFDLQVRYPVGRETFEVFAGITSSPLFDIRESIRRSEDG